MKSSEVPKMCYKVDKDFWYPVVPVWVTTAAKPMGESLLLTRDPRLQELSIPQLCHIVQAHKQRCRHGWPPLKL